VITFTGDGGFWYHIGELETAVRWKLNASRLGEAGRLFDPYE